MMRSTTFFFSSETLLLVGSDHNCSNFFFCNRSSFLTAPNEFCPQDLSSSPRVLFETLAGPVQGIFGWAGNGRGWGPTPWISSAWKHSRPTVKAERPPVCSIRAHRSFPVTAVRSHLQVAGHGLAGEPWPVAQAERQVARASRRGHSRAPSPGLPPLLIRLLHHAPRPVPFSLHPRRCRHSTSTVRGLSGARGREVPVVRAAQRVQQPGGRVPERRGGSRAAEPHSRRSPRALPPRRRPRELPQVQGHRSCLAACCCLGPRHATPAGPEVKTALSIRLNRLCLVSG